MPYRQIWLRQTRKEMIMNRNMSVFEVLKPMLPVLATALLACACSSGGIGEDARVPESGRGIMAATVENLSKSDPDDDEYLHNNFILDRSVIRVANTVNYAAPDFTDGTGGYYEYVYTTEGIGWDDNLPNFFPLLKGSEFGDEDRVDENGGFDWSTIVPTSNAFVFEAACYPMKYEYFDRVATDQSTKENFWSADLLLAHTRQPLADRYELLKLRFWHVFSMVRIVLELPIADADDDSGFPADNTGGLRTVESVTLNGMYVTYETRYTESIDNNAMRTVAGTDAGGRQDISMYRIPEKDGTVTNGGTEYQKCEFAAIVPVQQIRTQNTLLTLKIRTITGFSGEDMSEQKIESKEYVFVPSGTIDMMQGHVTVLRLVTASDSQEPVLVGAEVEDWNTSYTDVDLTPVQ